MKSLIFSPFCILRSKNTQATVKWVLKKKNHSLPQCSSSLKTDGDLLGFIFLTLHPSETHKTNTKQKEKNYFSVVIPFFDDVRRQGEESERLCLRLCPLPAAFASALCPLSSTSASALCPLPPSPPPPPPLVCESNILPSTKPLNLLMF